MARKSRKKTNENIVTTNRKKYSVGIYTRLSSLTEIKKDESSIENQINIILDYIKDNEEFSLCEIYSDTNTTGTNFERTGFEKLLEDIKSGKINCVIVKDLSRFGRNYIECGTYLEKIFPYIGVRFIAINDNYDSNNQNSSEILMMNLKNIVNELYAKDISKKIISAIKEKQKKGEYIGNFAPYGYLKSPDNKNKLIVNEETSHIIQKIFDLRLNGYSYNKITKALNDEKILSPYAYLYKNGILKNEKYKNTNWIEPTIKNILSNQVYIGNIVSNYAKIKNTHKPIISEDVFYKVQEINKNVLKTYNEKQKTNIKLKKKKTENIFKGLIKCGCCSKNLIRREKFKNTKNGVSIYRFFECYYSDKKQCEFKESVKEDFIKELVFVQIKKQIEIALDLEKLINKNNMAIHFTKEKLTNSLEKIEVEICKIQNLYKKIYEDYALNILDEKEYFFLKNSYNEKEIKLKDEREKIEKDLTSIDNNLNKDNKYLKNFLKFKNSKVLTKELLNILVKEIVVYDKTTIKITFNYADEYNKIYTEINEIERSLKNAI